MSAYSHDRLMLAPPRSLRQWGGFVHLYARFYQNYLVAVVKASRRRRHRSVDIDVQPSLDLTLWALHWATVGRNKLHDPEQKIGKAARINHLTDFQIDRLRGPKGQRPHRLITLLEIASEHNVRVEAEVKAVVNEEKVRRLLARHKIDGMNRKGLLQFKTLAFMGAPNGPINRLRPIHNAGGRTILTFTGFRKGGISKKAAWPVTDYVRGRAKWLD